MLFYSCHKRTYKFATGCGRTNRTAGNFACRVETSSRETRASPKSVVSPFPAANLGLANSYIRQPPLERIQRSVRNIDAAIRERQQTIDELSRRVASLRVSPRKILLSQSVARGPINFEPTKEIIAEIEASMASTEAKKNRLEKIKVARLTKLSVPRDGEDGGNVKRGSFTHEFVANGPIIINEIPLPGKLSPPPSPATESLP